ncbi:MAG TPA: HAD family hydrolase [Anaerolineales bacterium]|nr:HAD family hydrolase [Anaerolineales bacterium]
MNRWRAVVFDLDDTLYPERDYVRGGFEAVARWAGATFGDDPWIVFDELWAMFEAGVRGDTFDRWLGRHGRSSPAMQAAMIEAYRTHPPRLAPYADVEPTLASLRGTARLGLLTEGPASVQQSKLDALGLRTWFDKVVVLGEEERAAWKPSRTPFDRWLAGEAIGAQAAVYIGDNPAKDFLGARAAGWTSIRLRRSDGLHRDEEPAAEAARPDGEIPDLALLLSLLRDLAQETR